MRNAALKASAASDCEAEVVREDAQPDQAGQRGCSRMPAATRRRRLAPQLGFVVVSGVAPHRACRSHFFIR